MFLQLKRLKILCFKSSWLLFVYVFMDSHKHMTEQIQDTNYMYHAFFQRGKVQTIKGGIFVVSSNVCLSA